jgi:hypothetical protein
MLGGVRNRSATVIVTAASEPVVVARQEMKALRQHPSGIALSCRRAAQEQWRRGPATTPAAV